MNDVDPRIRVCGVCARILDYHSGLGWEHTAGAVIEGAVDHVAVPVEPGEVFAYLLCDFCYTPDPDWSIPATDFDVPGRGFGSIGNWAACRPCADLVDAGRWADVRRRVRVGHLLRFGEDLSVEAWETAGVLHRRLRQHITGSARPLAYPSPNDKDPS